MDCLSNRELVNKLMDSRVRILDKHPFFGSIVVTTDFAFSDSEKTVSTDGKVIYFNPKFLSALNNTEVDICILHEVMHIILKHPFRYHSNMREDYFHLACDIVVNSNIMYSTGSNRELVVNGRRLPHLAPDGKEGYLYSAEEIYSMFLKGMKDQNFGSNSKKKKKQDKQIDNTKQSDTSIAGAFAVNTIPVMKVKSTYDGDAYLRLFSFSDYIIGKGWDENVQVFVADGNNPLTFASDKVSSLYEGKHEAMTLSLLPDYTFDELPVPTYGMGISQYLQDDSGTINKDKYPNPFKFEYVPMNYTKEAEDILKLLPFADKSMTKEEKDYRKFVHKTFTNQPSATKKYFVQLASDNGLTKDDPNIITKVRNFIATSATYTVKHKTPMNGEDPTLFFMNISKEGKCTHFASAATLLYRAIGIPSRYVVGYFFETESDEEVDVYKEKAHAWVEVYVDGVGWLMVDPTPIVANPNPSSSGGSDPADGDEEFDGHSRWSQNQSDSDSAINEDIIDKKILEAETIQNSVRNISCGRLPGSVELIINSLRNPAIDWRVILNNYIQENIVDYSFCPPDKRFSDSNFLLPDFNEPDDVVKNVLFMVDVSGSMSDSDIVDCFSEIQGAIDQFNGALKGYIGFFDDGVHKVYEFDGDTDIKQIKPVGRGGTNFHSVFRYIKRYMSDNLPSTLIILSDGFAPFPVEEDSFGIPTLWIFNNHSAQDAPFGRTLRFESGKGTTE